MKKLNLSEPQDCKKVVEDIRFMSMEELKYYFQDCMTTKKPTKECIEGVWSKMEKDMGKIIKEGAQVEKARKIIQPILNFFNEPDYTVGIFHSKLPEASNCPKIGIALADSALELPEDEFKAIVCHEMSHIFMGGINQSDDSVSAQVEYVTDAIAAKVMIFLGINPKAGAELMERLNKLTEKENKQVWFLVNAGFEDHPPFPERIALFISFIPQFKGKK